METGYFIDGDHRLHGPEGKLPCTGSLGPEAGPEAVITSSGDNGWRLAGGLFHDPSGGQTSYFVVPEGDLRVIRGPRGEAALGVKRQGRHPPLPRLVGPPERNIASPAEHAHGRLPVAAFALMRCLYTAVAKGRDDHLFQGLRDGGLQARRHAERRAGKMAGGQSRKTPARRNGLAAARQPCSLARCIALSCQTGPSPRGHADARGDPRHE